MIIKSKEEYLAKVKYLYIIRHRCEDTLRFIFRRFADYLWIAFDWTKLPVQSKRSSSSCIHSYVHNMQKDQMEVGVTIYSDIVTPNFG